MTFTLTPGWAFVETEDWRKDLEASWTDVDSDTGTLHTYSHISSLLPSFFSSKALTLTVLLIFFL